MNKIVKIFTYTISVLSLLIVSACSNGSGPFEKKKIFCPDIFLLNSTDRIARYLNQQENDSNLIFEGKAFFSEGKCSIERNSNNLEIEFPIETILKRGEAFENANDQNLEQAKIISMFIGVSDETDNIVSRNVIDLKIDEEIEQEKERKKSDLFEILSRNRTSKPREEDIENEMDKFAYLREFVKVTIVLNKGDKISDYKIYVGFVLTPSELKINRDGFLTSF